MLTLIQHGTNWSRQNIITRQCTAGESEIDSYQNWYGVEGIMLDEMANVLGKESYSANLTKCVKTHYMTVTAGNLGVIR